MKCTPSSHPGVYLLPRAIATAFTLSASIPFEPEVLHGVGFVLQPGNGSAVKHSFPAFPHPATAFRVLDTPPAGIHGVAKLEVYTNASSVCTVDDVPARLKAPLVFPGVVTVRADGRALCLDVTSTSTRKAPGPVMYVSFPEYDVQKNITRESCAEPPLVNTNGTVHTRMRLSAQSEMLGYRIAASGSAVEALMQTPPAELRNASVQTVRVLDEDAPFSDFGGADVQLQSWDRASRTAVYRAPGASARVAFRTIRGSPPMYSHTVSNGSTHTVALQDPIEWEGALGLRSGRTVLWSPRVDFGANIRESPPTYSFDMGNGWHAVVSNADELQPHAQRGRSVATWHMDDLPDTIGTEVFLADGRSVLWSGMVGASTCGDFGNDSSCASHSASLASVRPGARPSERSLEVFPVYSEDGASARALVKVTDRAWVEVQCSMDAERGLPRSCSALSAHTKCDYRRSGAYYAARCEKAAPATGSAGNAPSSWHDLALAAWLGKDPPVISNPRTCEPFDPLLDIYLVAHTETEAHSLYVRVRGQPRDLRLADFRGAPPPSSAACALANLLEPSERTHTFSGGVRRTGSLCGVTTYVPGPIVERSDAQDVRWACSSHTRLQGRVSVLWTREGSPSSVRAREGVVPVGQTLARTGDSMPTWYGIRRSDHVRVRLWQYKNVVRMGDDIREVWVAPASYEFWVEAPRGDRVWMGGTIEVSSLPRDETLEAHTSDGTVYTVVRSSDDSAFGTFGITEPPREPDRSASRWPQVMVAVLVSCALSALRERSLLGGVP